MSTSPVGAHAHQFAADQNIAILKVDALRAIDCTQRHTSLIARLSASYRRGVGPSSIDSMQVAHCALWDSALCATVVTLYLDPRRIPPVMAIRKETS